jgi:predicted phage baseplate assembly protein
VAAPDINLDDRRFEDLVADLRRRIPGYTPEWTDLNDSDPGIALVQVFAWLAETILWRVNRVPDKSISRFLRLVGVSTHPAVPARARLTFTVSDSLDAAQPVRQGTVVTAGSDPDGRPILFETDEDLLAANVAVKAVQVYDGARFDLVTEANKVAGQFFFPLGEHPRRGAALYIGLSRAFPPGRHTLTVETHRGEEGDQGAVGVRLETPPPPAQVAWEYWAGDAPGWRALSIVRDDTVAMTESGAVVFDAPEALPMAVANAPVGLVPADDPQYWLRLRLVDLLGAGYETAPRIDEVMLNTVSAVNAVTVVDELVGASDGTPGQRFGIAQTPIAPDTLTLEVREALDEDFRPWTAVADLGASGRDDRHYTIDLGTGAVVFGDGRHGRVPPLVTDRRNAAEGRGDAPIANIRATRYRWGGGAAGNVGANAITALQTPVPFVESVTNHRPATGGRDAETFDEVRARAPQEIRTRSRAVTAQDFEDLARETPGAHIRRAKALPLHHPEFEPRRVAGPGQAATAVPVPGVVTMLVVPESDVPRPVIREETLDVVARHLSRHALITTEIYVARPTFRKVELEVRVIAAPSASLGEVGEAVEKHLLTYFHPLTGGGAPATPDAERGWPFGGAIFLSDTYREILSVPGVLRVESLRTFLDNVEQHLTEAQGAQVDGRLGPDELVWSERHRVEVRYE